MNARVNSRELAKGASFLLALLAMLSILGLHRSAADAMCMSPNQWIFSDDFQDCDISDWTVSQGGQGSFEVQDDVYWSSPCAIHMVSQGSSWASGTTPHLYFDTTQSYSMSARFMVPDSNNHWFFVLNNNQATLVIDYGTDLKVWQGDSLGALFVQTLTPGRWYEIECGVDPFNHVCYVFVDGEYKATAGLVGTTPLPYLWLGDRDVEYDYVDHGEAYWDDVKVCAYVSTVLIPNVPDWSQPCTDPNRHDMCAPYAAVNIFDYWDAGENSTPCSRDEMAALLPDTVANHIAWFMDTNDVGSPDRHNGNSNDPNYPSTSGTYTADQGPGIEEHAKWGLPDPDPPFSLPGYPPPTGKAWHDWKVDTHYPTTQDDGFDFYKTCIDAGRPVKVDFEYWHIAFQSQFIYDPTGDTIYVYRWDSETGGSGDLPHDIPIENWNHGSGPQTTGHAVTGVGYSVGENPDATKYAIVHDTWSGTPKDIMIPWSFWKLLGGGWGYWKPPTAILDVTPACFEYVDVVGGNIVTTITDKGIIGYTDGSQEEGKGVEFPKGASSQLYIGGLWVGRSASLIANRDYDADPEKEWRVSQDPAGNITGLQGPGDRNYACSFVDSAGTRSMGLLVRQESYAWSEGGQGQSRYVILHYEIENRGAERLDNLYAGLFCDWDIGADALQNSGKAEADRNLVYVYNPGDMLWLGARLLESYSPPATANLTLVDNATYVWPNAYVPDADKYLFLSAGDPAHVLTQSPHAGDYSGLVSAGPFTLEPGGSREVAFAIVAGRSLAELYEAADQAAAQVPLAAPDVDPASLGAARACLLEPGRPNPFRSSTKVRFYLNDSGAVDLGIYDISGRRIRELARGEVPTGWHEVNWDGRDDSGRPVTAGIYFSRIRANGQEHARRMLLLR